MEPQISIVIPAYNEEKRIKQCLRSMIDQDFQFPYEIIVVDNDSDDSTVDIILKNFPDVILVNEKKRGVGFSREKGFSTARADWIASMDADGYAPRDWLSTMWKVKEEKTDPIAIGGYVEFYDMRISSIFTKVTRRINTLEIGNMLFKNRKPMSTQNMLVKKEAWSKCGGFNQKIVSPLGLDDVEFTTRLSEYGNTYVSNKMVTYCSGRRYKYDLVKTLYHRNRALISYARGNIYDPGDGREVR